MRVFLIWLWLALGLTPLCASAQEITVTTVTRVPFSMTDANGDTGFSIDLMNAISSDLGWDVTYDRVDTFAQMLERVQRGTSDAAIANISITAERERLMDFSQPMFESGIQVMLPFADGSQSALWGAVTNPDLWLLIVLALLALFACGMLMWLFERGRQPYFDLQAKEAPFPAFWWALNLSLNGGFEERMPRSRMGRVFGVLMVLGSLFLVSIVVAQITAYLTVEAISDNVENLNDLDGRRIATTIGSTSSAFLEARQLTHISYSGLDEMLLDFERGRIEAVVFDGPILAYYVNDVASNDARLLERVYRPENYGVAFPTGSPLREDFDRALLRLREEGIYDALVIKWFGADYVR